MNEWHFLGGNHCYKVLTYLTVFLITVIIVEEKGLLLKKILYNFHDYDYDNDGQRIADQ